MSDDPSEFEQANTESRQSIVSEFLQFLREEKKWWLAPIIVVLLGVGMLLLLSATGAAPFIYTLF